MVDYTPAVLVCNVTDLAENEMKEVDFHTGATKMTVLVIKQNGVISSIGSKCSHYGAPLVKGVLGRGRVRCPAHGACFNIETGDIEDFPGMDSIPCYKVEVSLDGSVRVRAKIADLGASKRFKPLVGRNYNDMRTFIVVGAGAGGAKCVETLRQEGYTGRLIMIGNEEYLPYDRVKMSKAALEKGSIVDMQFRNEEFYRKFDIELLLSTSVTSVSCKEEKRVFCNNDASFEYDKLFISSGVRPFVPELEMKLKNVISISDYNSALNMYESLNIVSPVVIWGLNFGTLELAAAVYPRVSGVTIVGLTPTPFKQMLGEEIGTRIEQLYVEQGVQIMSPMTIDQIEGNENEEVTMVKLSDGTELDCSMLIVALGILPNTEFLQESGVQINDNGTINVNKHCMTNIEDIYAGGDIANSPIFSIDCQLENVNNLKMAQYHGHVAGINMARPDPLDKVELRAVPQSYTSIFGKSLRFAGVTRNVEDVYIDGSVSDLNFAAYYFDKEDNVVSVATMGRDPLASQFAELQYQHKTLNRCDILGARETTDWTQMLKMRPRC